MKRHWAYFKYIVRHKWFVFVAGLKIGASIWRLLIHDWSKFLPSEWIPYAHTFYDENGNTRYKKTDEFNMAWLMHQHRNPHHWQHWILREDSGNVIKMSVPNKYIKEMVADWMGAGRAITGKWEVREWYNRNKQKIGVSIGTKLKIEKILETL